MDVTFPGESAEYRAARDRLLDQEIELRRATEAVRGGATPDRLIDIYSRASVAAVCARRHARRMIEAGFPAIQIEFGADPLIQPVILLAGVSFGAPLTGHIGAVLCGAWRLVAGQPVLATGRRGRGRAVCGDDRGRRRRPVAAGAVTSGKVVGAKRSRPSTRSNAGFIRSRSRSATTASSRGRTQLDTERPVLKVMADYDSFPLWRADADGPTNVDPGSLPISPGLERDLSVWADAYDRTLNQSDPSRPDSPATPRKLTSTSVVRCSHGGSRRSWG